MKIFEIINYILLGLTIILFLSGSTFKTMHWPGASVLLLSTMLLGIITTTLFVILKIIKIARS